MEPQRVITSMQCRAARAMLKWGVKDLASRASVSATTINRFERDIAVPKKLILISFQRAFEDAGIEFSDGGGVRMRRIDG